MDLVERDGIPLNYGPAECHSTLHHILVTAIKAKTPFAQGYEVFRLPTQDLNIISVGDLEPKIKSPISRAFRLLT
jgi:hypothetical protein